MNSTQKLSDRLYQNPKCLTFPTHVRILYSILNFNFANYQKFFDIMLSVSSYIFFC